LWLLPHASALASTNVNPMRLSFVEFKNEGVNRLPMRWRHVKLRFHLSE